MAAYPGVDGQSFADIEKLGRDQWLDELAEELRNGTYQPRPVRRVYIPKGDGKQRPLGIPCIRDRVVQTATMLVLEPIFEADLEPEQHAYRPERSALDAVRQVERMLRSGHTEVVDADLSGYFDSIPHAELMKSVSRRISDGRVLRLISNSRPLECDLSWFSHFDSGSITGHPPRGRGRLRPGLPGPETARVRPSSAGLGSSSRTTIATLVQRLKSRATHRFPGNPSGLRRILKDRPLRCDAAHQSRQQLRHRVK